MVIMIWGRSKPKTPSHMPLYSFYEIEYRVIYKNRRSHFGVPRAVRGGPDEAQEIRYSFRNVRFGDRRKVTASSNPFQIVSRLFKRAEVLCPENPKSGP